MKSDAEREEDNYWARQEHAPKTREERIEDSIKWFMTEDIWEILINYGADDDLCVATKAILSKQGRTPEEEQFYKAFLRLAEKIAEYVND